MCAPSAPAAPDVKGAAEAQGASQRIDQYTPFGSLVYSPVAGSQTPGTQGTPGAVTGAPSVGLNAGSFGGDSEFNAAPINVPTTPGTPGTAPSGEQRWQSTTTLTPQAQQALESQLGLSAGMGQIAEGQLPFAQEQYSQPFDMSSVQDIADQSYGAQTARLDPQWQQRDQAMQQQLANQGIGLGSEAYSSAQRDFGQQRNDAYQQARLASIATMPQTYQLAASSYQQPLNILNALRTGAQVQTPQFGGAGQPTPYLQAAQQQGQWDQGLFNANMGAYNNQLSGAATIGAAMISDRRLKRNIERIGTHPLGVGIYEYDIFDRHEYGVMADEVLTVRPEAVVQHPSGYLMVNYGML